MKKILGIFLILATSLQVQAQIFEVKKMNWYLNTTEEQGNIACPKIII